MGDQYEVVILKYGTRQTLRSEVFLNYGVYGEGDAPIGMDYFVWVVRNADRTIVVDTGFSEAGGRARGRTLLLPVAHGLRLLGVDEHGPAPVVVLTHAHYDHAGNLELFPDSEIVVAARELDFWLSRHAGRAQFRHSVDTEGLDELRRAAEQGRVTTFAGEYALAPGVRVIEIGGHTPGQSAVLVATGEGTVLLASDAVHYDEEYERDMPFAFVSDLVATYEGFDRIRGMVASGEVQHVVAGHDPGVIDRFEPLAGELAGLGAVIGRREGVAA